MLTKSLVSDCPCCWRPQVRRPTLLEVAEQESASVELAGEMIANVEDDGRIMRDDAGRGDLRWWTNELISYEWDGD